MTYHNDGRNYHQIRPLTLYELSKEVNAVNTDIGAFRMVACDRERRPEGGSGSGGASRRDVLHSRPPMAPSILISIIKRTIDVTIGAITRCITLAPNCYMQLSRFLKAITEALSIVISIFGCNVILGYLFPHASTVKSHYRLKCKIHEYIYIYIPSRRVKFSPHVRPIYYARLRIPESDSTPGNG